MTTTNNEDQRVAEWMESLGFEKIGGNFNKIEYDKSWLCVRDIDATFFYKAQEANTKRILDKIESHGIHAWIDTDGSRSVKERVVQSSIIAQIRNEETKSMGRSDD